jgi:predicted ATP-grasp superfamily ATP-dependent carboligase
VALETVSAGLADDVDPALREAVRGLLAAYLWSCDARSLPGVVLAPDS